MDKKNINFWWPPYADKGLVFKKAKDSGASDLVKDDDALAAIRKRDKTPDERAAEKEAAKEDIKRIYDLLEHIDPTRVWPYPVCELIKDGKVVLTGTVKQFFQEGREFSRIENVSRVLYFDTYIKSTRIIFKDGSECRFVNLTQAEKDGLDVGSFCKENVIPYRPGNSLSNDTAKAGGKGCKQKEVD